MTVVGLDNLNSYYDVSLKEARLAQLRQQPNFRFEHLDLDGPRVHRQACLPKSGLRVWCTSRRRRVFATRWKPPIPTLTAMSPAR